MLADSDYPGIGQMVLAVISSIEGALYFIFQDTMFFVLLYDCIAAPVVL